MILTLGIITARWDCKIDWMIDSLLPQVREDDEIEVILVDHFHGERTFDYGPWFSHVPVMPNVWQGNHRLTKQHWWAVSAGRCTALCLAKSDWIAVADDRCVFGPQWLDAVRDAQRGNYAVAGAYEKFHNMVVEGGQIKSLDQPQSEGRFTGKDPRETGNMKPRKAPGQWFLGCTSALPLEWALNVNGWDLTCDSLGLEDCIFGQMLELNKYPIMYDERMKLWEDRTPGQCDVATIRTDKGVSPRDRSHRLLEITKGKLRATHDIDLRDIRARLERGEPWPIPTTPTHDYYDGQPLSEMEVR